MNDWFDSSMTNSPKGIFIVSWDDGRPYSWVYTSVFVQSQTGFFPVLVQSYLMQN